jgi:hypothetical protein
MRIHHLVAAAILVAGSATACGSGSKSPSAAVSSSPTLDATAKEAKARQFVECARKNGVPNVADPTVDAEGDIEISPPPGLTKQSPIVQEVMKICGKYLDGVFTQETQDPSKAYDQALKMADCIRKHGVPDFPDPSPPTKNGEGPRTEVKRGTGDPRLKKALDACKQYATVHKQ